MIQNLKSHVNWEEARPFLDGTFLSFIEVTGGVTGHAICRDGAISDGFNLHSAQGAPQQHLIGNLRHDSTLKVNANSRLRGEVLGGPYRSRVLLAVEE